MKDPACPDCECGLSLAISTYVHAGGRLLKSCLTCSRLAGEHRFHTVPEFGLHRTRDYADGTPSIQSHCLASTAERIRVGTKILDSDFEVQMTNFDVTGRRCRELGEVPRLGTDDAIRELIEVETTALAEMPAPRESRPRQSKARAPRVQKPAIPGPTVSFNPDRAPRAYDDGACYEVGDRIIFADFGTGVVTSAEPHVVVIVGDVGARVLVHNRRRDAARADAATSNQTEKAAA